MRVVSHRYPANTMYLSSVQCWTNVEDVLPTLCKYHTNALCLLGSHHNVGIMLSQQTRYVDTMLAQCWTDVVDGGPILGQYWVNVSCLLRGIYRIAAQHLSDKVSLCPVHGLISDVPLILINSHYPSVETGVYKYRTTYVSLSLYNNMSSVDV